MRIRPGDKVHKDTFEYVCQDGIRQAFSQGDLVGGYDRRASLGSRERAGGRAGGGGGGGGGRGRQGGAGGGRRDGGRKDGLGGYDEDDGGPVKRMRRAPGYGVSSYLDDDLFIHAPSGAGDTEFAPVLTEEQLRQVRPKLSDPQGGTRKPAARTRARMVEKTARATCCLDTLPQPLATLPRSSRSHLLLYPLPSSLLPLSRPPSLCVSAPAQAAWAGIPAAARACSSKHLPRALRVSSPPAQWPQQTRARP